MNFNIVRNGVVGALAVLCLVAAAAPARADWLRAETEHFIVYGDTSEASLRRYAGKIERFDAFLRTYYPIRTEYQTPKLEIFMADGRRDMLRVSPGIGESVAGYYSSNSGRIYTVVNTRSAMGDIVAYHEYAHHFMFQMKSNAYPSWFVEGFAEYYSTAETRGERVQFGRHNPGRMNSLTAGANTWAKMDDVLKWRVNSAGRYPAHLYYAQAWAMTHYFMSTPERTRMLSAYLAAVTGGEDSIAAMQTATGRTTSQLQAEIWSYVSGPIKVWTPQIELPEPTVAVSRLNDAQADAVWLDIRLDNTPVIEDPDDEGEAEGGPPLTAAQRDRKEREAQEEAEYRAELIRSAHALAEAHKHEAIGGLLAARAYRLERRPDLAMEALRPFLNDQTDNADVLRVAAMALLDQAGAEESRETATALRRSASQYLARAMDADPLDFRIYLGLNDTRRGHPQYPTPNDLATLEAAYALAPQSFDTRLRLGQAYIASEMPGAAITVLLPVSNSPHRSGYSRQARAMINQALAAAGEKAATFEEAPEDEPSGGEAPAPTG